MLLFYQIYVYSLLTVESASVYARAFVAIYVQEKRKDYMEDVKVDTRSQEEIMAQMQAVHNQAKQLLDGIIALFGAGQIANRVAYCRGLAIERLEECMHRVGDGVQFMVQNTSEFREKTAESVLAGKGTPDLQVVTGGAQ